MSKTQRESTHRSWYSLGRLPSQDENTAWNNGGEGGGDGREKEAQHSVDIYLRQINNAPILLFLQRIWSK